MAFTLKQLWDNTVGAFYEDNEALFVRYGYEPGKIEDRIHTGKHIVNEHVLFILCSEFYSQINGKSDQDKRGRAIMNNKDNGNTGMPKTVRNVVASITQDRFATMEHELLCLFRDSVTLRRYREKYDQNNPDTIGALDRLYGEEKAQIERRLAFKMDALAKHLRDSYANLFETQLGTTVHINGENAVKWLVVAICLALNAMECIQNDEQRRDEFHNMIASYARALTNKEVAFGKYAYFEKLWKTLSKALYRDSRSETVRDLIEVYVQPKFAREADGALMPEPLLGADGPIYRMVLSPSGYGKTTMMHAVAVCTLVDRLADSSVISSKSKALDKEYKALQQHFFGTKVAGELVPLFIEAQAFNEHPEAADLSDLALGSDCAQFQDILSEADNKGKLLIFIDGVDEVKGTHRNEFFERLESLIGKFPNASCLVTSRFKGQEEELGVDFRHRYLKAFELDDIEKLLKLLLPDAQMIEQIVKTVRTQPYWQEIFSNPFLLTSVVYGGNFGNLANVTPVTILQRSVTSIIRRRWKKHESEPIEQALSYAALRMVRENTDRLSTEEMRKSFEKAKQLFGQENEQGMVAEEMGWRSGILTIVEEENGKEMFQFQSPILQHYLAGTCIAYLLKRFGNVENKEVIIEMIEKLYKMGEETTIGKLLDSDLSLKEAVWFAALKEAGVSMAGGERARFGHMLTLSNILYSKGDELTAMRAKALAVAITQLDGEEELQRSIVEYLLFKGMEPESQAVATSALTDVIENRFGFNRVTNRGALRDKVEAYLVWKAAVV